MCVLVLSKDDGNKSKYIKQLKEQEKEILSSLKIKPFVYVRYFYTPNSTFVDLVTCTSLK